MFQSKCISDSMYHPEYKQPTINLICICWYFMAVPHE